MKNLLRSTLYLTVFALAGILFQISCSNSENQNTIQTTNQIGKIVYETGDKIWTANYDGTNATQIPIVLPSNLQFFFGTTTSSLSVSPDGNTIFFTCYNSNNQTSTTTELYSSSISGGTATLVIPIPSGSTGSEHVGHAVAY